MTAEFKLRKFNDAGIEEFLTYLAALRAGSTASPPFQLLTDSKTSESISEDCWIEQRRFENRMGVALYLDEVLAEIAVDNIENDIHLWSWLSLFYFDQVCPSDKTNRRKPGRDYRHILEPGYPFGHRHLIGGAYLVFNVYGCREDISPPLLSTPLNVENRFYHQLVVRQSFITNRGIMEAAYRLYFDNTTKKLKRGAQAMKSVPGTLFRFIDVIQQLDLNYDLYSMTGDEIISILPQEFEKWKG